MINNSDPSYPLRHSSAHILASAILRLFPNAKFGVGPVINDGFYYDIDIPDVKLSESDFSKIESMMLKIIKEDQEFIQYDLPIDEALSWAKSHNQPYKLELLNDLKRTGTTIFKELDASELGVEKNANDTKVDKVSFYKNGDFEDLCRGPHVRSTSEVEHFKLMRISGAYWRGDQSKAQMQRIYGVTFKTKAQLDEYFKMLEEAKQRDHRKLGQELDLFLFSDLVGSGLPLFTPRGTVLREELLKFSNELRENIGFQKVHIPHITKQELYKVSGHLDKFGDQLFLVKSQETKDQFILKPMNCPHHTQIFASKQRSYKDLPIRYLETTVVYRDEKSGELGGLNRVRSITQDDSHVFCTNSQVKDEIHKLLDAVKELYKAVGLDLKVRLSYRDDKEGYLGSKEVWELTQAKLKEAVIDNKLEYYEEEGEAAFYGPKIDFMATDSLKREHQVATIQLDFIQPERFKLEYDDQDGSKQHPIMIHCAFLGSIERFLAVYIEHTAGRFPVWLAPEQIRIITLNQSDEIINFVNELMSRMKSKKLRITVDNNNESVSKKIRSAEINKVPYVVVIGNREVESGIVIPRVRNDLIAGNKVKELQIDDFMAQVEGENNSRAMLSSLEIE